MIRPMWAREKGHWHMAEMSLPCEFCLHLLRLRTVLNTVCYYNMVVQLRQFLDQKLCVLYSHFMVSLRQHCTTEGEVSHYLKWHLNKCWLAGTVSRMLQPVSVFLTSVWPLLSAKFLLTLIHFTVKQFNLSLIHIWRCRRSTLCRSRWSPYH